MTDFSAGFTFGLAAGAVLGLVVALIAVTHMLRQVMGAMPLQDLEAGE